MGGRCCAAIPGAQRAAEQGERATGDERAALAEIAVALVEPPRGCVAVDELAAVCANPVRPTARAAYDDVGLDVHGREGGRKQRQRQLMAAPQKRDPVQRGRLDPHLPQFGERSVGRIERRVQRRAGECARQRQRHPLGAATLGQVVVDERDAHVTLR